jgi:hypothetical protein
VPVMLISPAPKVPLMSCGRHSLQAMLYLSVQSPPQCSTM